MTVKQALLAVGFGRKQMSHICCANATLIVKRYNQHPCDPPVGEVVDIHYNTDEESYEILFS